MKKYSLLLIVIGASMLVANEFVVQKPSQVSQKKRSHSQLKETIAHKQATALNALSESIEKLAQMQQRILDDAQNVLRQNKKTIFASKDCELLQEYETVLDTIIHSCNRMRHECTSELHNREIVVAQTA